MIGICYFADKNNEYLAEAQVRAIVDGFNDQVMLIKENTEPDAYKVDALIEEAAKNKCDSLVLLTEEKNYNTLSQAVPQIYGDMFESIDVVPENFIRIRENDAAAVEQPVQNAAPQQQQQVQPEQQVQQQQTIVNKNQPCNGTTFILCNQMHLDPKSMQNWWQTAQKFYNEAISAGVAKENIRLCPVTVDSAHLNGAAFVQLAQAFPKAVNSSFTGLAKQINGNAPDFCLQTDASSVIQAFILSAGQTKQKNEKGEETERVDNQQRTAINIYAPNELYQYLSNAAANYSDVDVRVMSMGGSFENPNNAKIVELFKVLRNTSQDLKAGSKKDKDWEDVQKDGTNNIDRQTISYIQTICQCMKQYEESDHKKPMNRAEAESALEKVISEELRKLSGIDNLKKDWTGTPFGAGLELVQKVGKAVKNDMKKGENDAKKNLFDEKKTGKRNDKNIYLWEHYDELRKLLIGK